MRSRKTGKNRKGVLIKHLWVLQKMTLYLVNFAEHDSPVELFHHGAEEFLLDYCDVETLLLGKGIKPLLPDPTLVQQEGLFTEWE